MSLTTAREVWNLHGYIPGSSIRCRCWDIMPSALVRVSAGSDSSKRGSGVTFLTTFRELQGRDRPIKLFEALKKASLTASLATAFRAPAAELENIWLKRVREYHEAEEITIVAEDARIFCKPRPFPSRVNREQNSWSACC